ncbi:MAG: iron-containing redox enzyme family protein [Deltaproteobacteria bacterium]|nr:iron-containing redox enzyme family protein [Deltaproteobacteria bacterium]
MQTQVHKQLNPTLRAPFKSYQPTSGEEFWDVVVRETAEAKRKLYADPCFKSLCDGTMPLNQYKEWLKETYHFTRNTPRFLSAAGSQVEDDKQFVRTRFFQHAVEENGHHLMALKDLRNLGVDEESVKKTYPCAGTTAIVSMHYYLAHYTNPIGIFGAVFCFEGLAFDLCDQWAKNLKAHHGLSNNCLTFIISHGHFDIEHIKEAKEVINHEVITETDRRDIIYTANKMYDYYRLTFEEIGQLKD